MLGDEEGRIVLRLVRGRGFTLVELMVGMSIIAILAAFGLPAMATFLQNSKLSNAAASYYAGIQAARAEAIRRNVETQFVLTNTAVTTANLPNALAPSVNGVNWVVRVGNGPGSPPPAFLAGAVDAKSGMEGEGNTSAPAIRVVGAGVGATVFDGRIRFNGFGTPPALPGGGNEAYVIDISNPAAGPCGPIHCRRITVSQGGQVASCDLSAAPGDSRAC
jgi:type IV fimbrial biogenesis protein FimT